MSEQTEKHERADLTAGKLDDLLARLRRGFPFGQAIARQRNAGRVRHSWVFLGVLPAVLLLAGCLSDSPFGFTNVDFALSVRPQILAAGASATGMVTIESEILVNSSGDLVRDVEVQLTSSNPVVTVPKTIILPKGGKPIATFTVMTTEVSQPTQVTITAAASVPSGPLLFDTQKVVLTVNPPAVASVMLSFSTVTTGMASIGTVTLTAPAPPGGAVVMLLSSNTSAATVPPNVTVPAGATTATFTVTTVPVTTQATATITASYNGSANAQLTVNPPPPTLTSINITRGYQGKKYAVTLTGTNFTPGATVNAGTGVTVTNISVSPDGTSATGTFNIGGPTAAPTGTHYVSVTTPSGTTHNLVGFIVEAYPTLAGISPASGVQGKTGLLLTITGTNFDPGATVTTGGTGVTVTSNSVSADQTKIEVTVDIAADATLGSHGVIVNTNGEVLSEPNITFTVDPATTAPTLTSITPASGAQGTSVNVTLTGTGFISGVTVNTGPGVNVTNLNVVNSTTITATFVIAADASLGAQNVKVTTSSGTSGSVPFTVTPAAPTLASISPTSGTQGTNVNVTLTGTGFASPMAVNTGAGVTASNVTVVNSTTATATFTIDPTAPTGAQNFSVTTNGMTSNTVPFTVNPAGNLGLFKGPWTFQGHGRDAAGNVLGISWGLKSDGLGGLNGEYNSNDKGLITTGTLTGTYAVDSTSFANATIVTINSTLQPTSGSPTTETIKCFLSADGKEGDCAEVDENRNLLMGPIYLQDLSAFLISSLAGPYAFKMESRSPFEGMDGSLIIAPNGTLNGTVDRSKSGVGPVASNLAIIGSVTAPDQFGGFSSQIGNAAFNLKFSSFVIDANRFTSMEADSGAGGALFIGDDVRQQPPVPDPTSGSYGPTSLVCRMHGSDPASGGEVFTVSQLVLTNFGSIGVTFDTNANGTIIGPATTPGTGFSFDVNSGRYAADYNNVPGWMFSSTMYFIDPNSAIILDTTPGASAQAKVGTCLAQTSPANSIVPSGNMPVEITGSNKQGTPDNLGLSGIVNADAATQKMDADFDLDITGSPTALSLAGTISFTLPDATGRGGLVLPGQFFGLQIPTVIGTYYGIDSSRFVFVSATPGVPIVSGFFGKQ